MATIYLTSPTGGYATSSTIAGALALEKVSGMRRCTLAQYRHVQAQAHYAPSPALPPAPKPGQLVRLPLDQLSQYLHTFGLVITRRVELAGGGWRVDLEDDPSNTPPVEC